MEPFKVVDDGPESYVIMKQSGKEGAYLVWGRSTAKIEDVILNELGCRYMPCVKGPYGFLWFAEVYSADEPAPPPAVMDNPMILN